MQDVFLRMLAAKGLQIESGAHLFHIAGSMMRRMLIDRTRRAGSEKHGGDQQRVDFIEAMQLPISGSADVELLDTALDRLEQIDPRLSRVVELRYFVGLSVPAVAAVLEVDKRTVYRDWTFAKTWLRREMEQ